jgi:hypothetical protein
MNKGERDALVSLVKRRARVASSDAEARAAEMLADFERQMDTRYAYDSDDVWQQAVEAVKAVAAEAEVTIRARCRELGIPDQCAPGLSVGWYDRGRNAASHERAEMRRVATRRIEAIRAAAVAAIHRASVEYETTLIAGSLTSDAAKLALQAMPAISALMPMLDGQAIIMLTQENRHQRARLE